MLNLAHLPDVSGMEQDMMSAALVYAETGFPVFPCRNKKPITDHGHKDATTDEAIIRKWWTRNPDAQIGTPTGPASGVWALDEDLPDGPDTLEQLIDTYGPLPPTRTQQTGSGGKQFLFSWNGCQVRNSTSKIGPDIDVRGDGGYIILPPSGHPSGGVYQWINELSPAAAPDWLSELALNPRRPKTALQDTNAATFQGTAYGRAALEREVERVSTASEGTRNDTLNKAAFALGQLVAGNGLSENDVLTALSNAALENGLEHREVEKTIQSGIEAGKQNPRSISNDGYDRGNNLPSSRESSTGALRDGNDGNDGITEDRTTLTLPPPPLDVFYYDIRKAMENIAETKKPPIEVCVSGILALASGLVGRSRGITIKAGWSERGNLYIGLVGRSSCGKSPAINSIFKPIYEKEKRYQEQYQREMEAYELALQEWRSRKKDAPPEPKPEPPVRIDLVLDDWTIEAAADSLSANPRGVLLYRDELAGMLMDLDKYSGEKGATKTRLMTAYDGSKPWKISRATSDRSNFIPEPCVSLYGGIQPAIAKDLFNNKDIDSGFLGRFMFIQAIQRVPATFSEEEESMATQETLKKLVNGLDSFSFHETTQYIQVSAEAKQTFISWHDKLAYEAWFAENDGEGSLLNKIRAQGLRVCLILHCIDAVMNEQDEMMKISNDTMVKALKLMDWIRTHTQATWKMLMDKAATPSGQDVRVAQAIFALEGEITNSWLPTGRITELVNDGLDHRYHLTAEQVGRACKGLQLENKAKSHARGFIITPEDIKRLSSFVPEKEPSYLSYVSEPSIDGAYEYDTSESAPSYPSCHEDDEGVPI